MKKRWEYALEGMRRSRTNERMEFILFENRSAYPKSFSFSSTTPTTQQGWRLSCWSSNVYYKKLPLTNDAILMTTGRRRRLIILISILSADITHPLIPSLPVCFGGLYNWYKNSIYFRRLKMRCHHTLIQTKCCCRLSQSPLLLLSCVVVASKRSKYAKINEIDALPLPLSQPKNEGNIIRWVCCTRSDVRNDDDNDKQHVLEAAFCI